MGGWRGPEAGKIGFKIFEEKGVGMHWAKLWAM